MLSFFESLTCGFREEELDSPVGSFAAGCFGPETQIEGERFTWEAEGINEQVTAVGSQEGSVPRGPCLRLSAHGGGGARGVHPPAHTPGLGAGGP